MATYGILSGEPLGGFSYAEKQPVRHSAVSGGGARVEPSGGQIYVTVLRGPASQDDSDGRAGHEQRRDRHAPRYAPRSGECVAQALLQGAIGGFGRTSPPGSTSSFSPQSWSLRSRRWPVSCRQPCTCRCGGWAWPMWSGKRNARGWWRASATARYGTG